MEEFEKIKMIVKYQGYYYKISEIIKNIDTGIVVYAKNDERNPHNWSKSKRISRLLIRILKHSNSLPLSWQKTFNSRGLCRNIYK